MEKKVRKYKSSTANALQRLNVLIQPCSLSLAILLLLMPSKVYTSEDLGELWSVDLYQRDEDLYPLDIGAKAIAGFFVSMCLMLECLWLWNTREGNRSDIESGEIEQELDVNNQDDESAPNSTVVNGYRI